MIIDTYCRRTEVPVQFRNPIHHIKTTVTTRGIPPDIPRGQFWLRHFQNLWDNGAKTSLDRTLPYILCCQISILIYYCYHQYYYYFFDQLKTVYRVVLIILQNMQRRRYNCRYYDTLCKVIGTLEKYKNERL